MEGTRLSKILGSFKKAICNKTESATSCRIVCFVSSIISKRLMIKPTIKKIDANQNKKFWLKYLLIVEIKYHIAQVASVRGDEIFHTLKL